MTKNKQRWNKEVPGFRDTGIFLWFWWIYIGNKKALNWDFNYKLSSWPLTSSEQDGAKVKHLLYMVFVFPKGFSNLPPSPVALMGWALPFHCLTSIPNSPSRPDHYLSIIEPWFVFSNIRSQKQTLRPLENPGHIYFFYPSVAFFSMNALQGPVVINTNSGPETDNCPRVDP